MSIELIDPKDYHFVSQKCREFFLKKGMIEAGCQHRLSIMAACEDPSTLTTFDYTGKVWPLPQTSQMWLEYEILKNPEPFGYFSFSTSYRQEDPTKAVEGRHNLIFPMIEFEIKGDMEDLIKFECEFLEHLGYGPRDSFPRGDYLDVAKKYNTKELEHEHEQQMYKDYGPVFFLCNFPEYTDPFFNMKRNPETGLACKVDVIMSGIETIGSAERGCDADDMRLRFHTITEGKYASTLYSRFGVDRVNKELDEFLGHNFVQRSGAGIGMTRLIKSLKKEGLMPKD